MLVGLTKYNCNMNPTFSKLLLLIFPSAMIAKRLSVASTGAKTALFNINLTGGSL